MEDSGNCTLFDVSSENDSLIVADASSSTLTHHQFSEPKGFEQIGDLLSKEVDCMGVCDGQKEQLLETEEPETLRKTGKCNLRKSLAWDSAFLESPEPKGFEQIGDLMSKEVDCMGFCDGQKEQLLETEEPETLRKTGKCNLRKSLAWDSAFFESPGFLDTEELSTMIEGAENSKIPHLPGIDEDIGRSTESISSLLSSNLTLESLEVDLFEDIRASIQKSGKASSMATTNHKAALKETIKPVGGSVKAVDVTSQTRMAKDTASAKQTIGKPGCARITKKDSRHSQVNQVITKSEVLSTITTKRASLCANRIKTETNNSKVGGKGIQVPKSAGLAGPRRSVPKPAVSLKTSSSVTLGAIKEPGSSSSLSTSSNIILPKGQKSSLPSARRKTEHGPVNQPSSYPIPKVSSRVPPRKKPSNKSGLSTFLPLSKIPSSISPSSSISEWSSASSSTSTVNQRLQARASIDTNTLCSTVNPASSSTSTVNQRLQSRASIDTNTLSSTVNQKFLSRTSIDTNSSCRSLDSDTYSFSCLDIQSNDDIPEGILNQVKELSSQDTRTTSVQSGVVSRSALVKPSGLRMPSPKIGFFDGAKSMVRTPNGCRQSQSRLPTGLPKIGAAISSPAGNLKKAGEVKLQPGKKTTGASTVFNPSKCASPKPSSQASTKGLRAQTSVLSPSISSELGSSKKKGTRKMRTSTNTELECLKSASPKQFQETLGASPVISPEVQNETGFKGLKTEDMEMGKADGTGQTLVDAAQGENNENLFLNI